MNNYVDIILCICLYTCNFLQLNEKQYIDTTSFGILFTKRHSQLWYAAISFFYSGTILLPINNNNRYMITTLILYNYHAIGPRH